MSPPPRPHWPPPGAQTLPPIRIEVDPMLSELSAIDSMTHRRRATTLRLEPGLHARLRVARKRFGRTGQSIMVEALTAWLRAHRGTN